MVRDKRSIVESVTNMVMESLRDDLANGNIGSVKGRKPKSLRARMNQIYRRVHDYRIDSRLYHDDSWQALRDYDAVISSLGGELSYWCENGGYTDFDETTGIKMSKVYEIEITYDDGMSIRGYIKMMAAGSMDDPFSAYDTCIVMWPKNSKGLS